MTERDEHVLLEIFRNEIRWYHFATPFALNIVTDRRPTDAVKRLALAGRVDVGTAEPGSYSVPILIEGPGSTSPEPGPPTGWRDEATGLVSGGLIAACSFCGSLAHEEHPGEVTP